MKSCVLLLLVAVSAAASAVGPVFLTLTYCTSDFAGKGAVLSVDPSTGKYAVVGHPFTWPQISSDGCPVQYDPNVFSSSNLSYLVRVCVVWMVGS